MQSIEARIENLAKTQETYTITDRHTISVLSKKVLVEIIAPAVEGKSTVKQITPTLDGEFSEVTGFTTRSKEARDTSGILTYYDTPEKLESIVDKIEAGRVVQYAVHPTTKKVYGSFIDDYRTHFNTLDTLASSVKSLDAIPFERIVKIGLVSRGKEWIQRFVERYPEPSQERAKRMQEAVSCLRWLIDQEPGVISWVENSQEHGPQQAARDIIAIAKHGRPSPDLRHYAEEMLHETEGIQ